MADWQAAVDMKPGSYVNMPVCAYSFRMSMTSGPTLPWYTGRSTLGLPLENDSVALLSASFIAVPNSFSMPNLPGCGNGGRPAQHFQHIHDLRTGQFTRRFPPSQQQVQQVVVREVHQLAQ